MIKNISEQAHRLEWDSFIVFKDNQVEVTTDELIRLAEEFAPKAIDKIRHSLPLLDGNPELFLDKLGIDFLINHNNRRYAIDVTVAKRISIMNKIDKMADRKKFYDSLGATPVIVRSPNGLVPDNIMELIEQSSVRKGVIDCRLGTDLCLIK